MPKVDLRGYGVRERRNSYRAPRLRVGVRSWRARCIRSMTLSEASIIAL
jgi:hypothetical protein